VVDGFNSRCLSCSKCKRLARFRHAQSYLDAVARSVSEGTGREHHAADRVGMAFDSSRLSMDVEIPGICETGRAGGRWQADI
jgi:hypothetical protein